MSYVVRKGVRRVVSATGGKSSGGSNFPVPPRDENEAAMSPRPSNGSVDANERTPMLAHVSSRVHQVTGRVAHVLNDDDEEDDRAWVRIPKRTARAVWKTLASNYVNLLLVFVPLGIVAGATGWNPTTVFILNFLAIIPLAALLSFATEELAAKMGQTIGGLLNASFGNAVELIVSIVALKNGEIRIVQSSMLGSILSNVLLVLGCCFLFGGYGRLEQHFNTTVASTLSSLMAVASASLVIPATLYGAIQSRNEHTTGQKQDAQSQILVLSRGTSIILLVLYVMYLYFQLYSHAKLFDEDATTRANNSRGGASGAAEAGQAGLDAPQEESHEQEEEPEDTAGQTLSPAAAAVALVIITIFVAVCAEYLVDSIDAIVQTAHISRTFIGLILIPIVGNAAEHVTAVIVARKDKMDLAIGVALGSSLQIAILVTPFLVILGWIIGQEMTLHFEIFETVVFFLSTTVVYYLIQDGTSNYLEGAMLLGTYAIIALAFYVYPDEGSKSTNLHFCFT
ncbi:MAG: hypothetical protein M1823_003907 [Watsoniomyces obsoletus]|nr:MAG: hypothetical protein M1823_003907 [Watsoniomyces obsoletus]